MNHMHRTAIAWLFSGLLLAGCDQTGSTSGENSGGGKDAAVQIDVASLEEVQKFVADQKGKVVVLDLWSSSCTPCIRELPGLAKLHKEHPEDVVTVSLNLDYYGSEAPEKLREPAAKILAENGAAAKNFLSSTKDEDVYAKVGATPVPIVIVYDRTGKMAKLFVNNNEEEYGKEGFTYKDHIAPLVKELVAAKGS
jgi:thiol-disulfide isomerase/thioredoxin